MQLTGPLVLPAAGAITYPLRVDDAEVRADIGASELALGVMGGRMPVDHFATEITRGMPAVMAAVHSAFESIADVSPGSLGSIAEDI